MNLDNFYLQKIVISSGLGGRQKTEIQNISEHLKKLLKIQNKPKITTCKTDVALWKIRKGKTPMGVMVTLRKRDSLNFLKVLGDRCDWSKSKYHSSSLRVGINSHRTLNIEKYSHKDPEYGFNVTLNFGFKGKSSWKRRINPCTKKLPVVQEEVCRIILENCRKKL